MKKIAFFIALFVSLNATVVAKKPDEDELQVSVVKDYNSANRNNSTWFQNFANKIMLGFYGITKEGVLQEISWERILNVFKQQKTKPNNSANLNRKSQKLLSGDNRLIWLQMQYHITPELEKYENTVFVRKKEYWKKYE